VISANGITPDPEKIEILKNFKRPTSVVEIQSFLGLASYYRRFIKYFADIAHPLKELTKGKNLKTIVKAKRRDRLQNSQLEATLSCGETPNKRLLNSCENV
jgi:hypothetical protein